MTLFDADHGMRIGKQDMVVQPLDDPRQSVSKCDEVDTYRFSSRRPFDFSSNAIVVAMQAFADIPREGNEMRGTEDELFFWSKTR